MVPTHQNNALSVHHQGLNGFWSAIGRFAKRMAAKGLRWAAKKLEVDSFGVANLLGLSDIINNWADQLEASANASTSKEIAESQLTTQEIGLLTQFAELKLGPFARKAVDNFFNQINSGSVEQQLAAANKILKLKNALIAYFSYNQTQGLSAIAIEQKLQIIEALFLPIEDVITNTFDENFSRMYVNDQVNSSELPDYSNLIPSTFVNQPFEVEKLVPNVPVSEIPVQQVATPTTPASNTGVVATTPGNSTVQPQPTKKKGVVALLLLVGGYLLFSGGNSNKSKN